MPRTINFEGRTITVPDDFTDAEVANILASSPAQEPAPAPEQPFRNSVGPQGTMRSIADTIGFPLDYASAGAQAAYGGLDLASQAVGGPDLPDWRPMAPSDAIATLASKGGELLGIKTTDVDDMSGAERLLYETNRFAGGAATGAGLLSRVNQASKAAPKLVRTLAEPYTAGKIAPLIGDTSAGAGAGATVAGYQEGVRPFLEDNISESAFNVVDPVAQVFSMLAGGLGGATVNSAAQGAVKGGVNAGQRLLGLDKETSIAPNTKTGEHFSKGDVNQVAGLVQEQATNPALAARTIEEDTASFLPNYRPEQQAPTGLMSEDPGLVSLENRMRQADPVPFIEQDQRANSAIRDQLDTLEPGGNPRDLTNKANTDYGRRVARAEGRVTAAEAALGRQDRQMRVEANRTGLPGRSAATEEQADMDIYRALKEGTLEPMQARNKERYDAVDAAPAGELDTKGLVRLADRIEKNTGALSALPAKTRSLLARVKGLKEEIVDEEGQVVDTEYTPITARDIKEVLPELSQISRAARTSLTPNLALADDIDALRGGLTRMIGKAAKAGDEASVALNEARTAYRKPGELGGTFGEGQARKFRDEANAARFDKAKQRPSQVASDFVKPQQPELAEELTGIMNKSDRPLKERRRIVREKMLSNLAASGVIDEKTGQIRPDALRKWRDKWGSTIDAIDNGSKLRRDVDAWLDRAQRGSYERGALEADIRAAETRLTEVQRDKGALGAILDKDPDHAVSSVFNSNDPERGMKALKASIKNNERAKSGLKAAVRDWLIETKTTSAVEKTQPGDPRRPVSWAKLEETFNKHEKVLAQVYSKEEMNALRQMHKMLGKYTGRNQQATTKSPTAERLTDKAFMKTLELGSKAYFGILKGGGVFRTIKLALERLPNNEESVAQLMRQMAFDPDLAVHLLRREAGKDVPTWNAKLNRMIAYGQGRRAFLEDNADDEEDEDAVPDPAR
jgi:hypothetical protein